MAAALCFWTGGDIIADSCWAPEKMCETTAKGCIFNQSDSDGAAEMNRRRAVKVRKQ